MAEPTNIITAGCGVIPHLAVSDGVGALDFYKKAFGAEEFARMPAQDGKRIMHASLKINGGPVILNDFFPEHGYAIETPKVIVLHLQVADVEMWWKRAIDAGCTVVMPLETMFWGDRYGQLSDPYGYRWSIAQTL